MTRTVHLDEHVSRVQSSVLELLDSTNCNLLLLSDVQVAVLEQMTFPYVRYKTRLILDRGQYQELVEMPQAYLDELECLELVLSGGSTMTCDLSAVLAELASAIRSSGSGNGGCAPSGPAAILNCVGSMTPEELIPQTEEPAPQYGVPPEGFDDWPSYLDHKCKAAHAIVDAVAGLFGALALAPITITVIEAIQIILTGYVGGIALGATVFPPAALVGIAAGALALGLLEGAAFLYLADVQQYILAHKGELACVLYNSGSAAVAQAGIASVVEDAIQGVAWASIFGPAIGGEIAAALGGIAGSAQTNNLVNPLFRVVEDFVYPDMDCGGCGGPSGLEFHFDVGPEDWTCDVIQNEGDVVSAEWTDEFYSPDPSDSSAGLLAGYIHEATPPLGGVFVIWGLDFLIDNRPTVQVGDALTVDYFCNVYAHSGVNVLVFYTDETYDSHAYPNVTGWNECSCAGTAGKVVERLQINFGMGEGDEEVSYALDNVRWGQ